jgi:hypothetical protein
VRWKWDEERTAVSHASGLAGIVTVGSSPLSLRFQLSKDLRAPKLQPWAASGDPLRRSSLAWKLIADPAFCFTTAIDWPQQQPRPKRFTPCDQTSTLQLCMD